MTTLYDLLGALPNDDAEEIRVAFRKAVKGVHPDVNPGDPEAAAKFRQIIRAHDILSDSEQRAAYDHLLTLAREEQEQESKLAVVAKVHKVASGVMALTVASAAAVGGYLLFMHMSAASVAPLKPIVVTTDRIKGGPGLGKPVETAALAPEAASSTDSSSAVSVPTMASAPPEQLPLPVEKVDDVYASDEERASCAQPQAGSSCSNAEVTGAVPAQAPGNDAKFYHERAMASYHKGDLMAAMGDLNQAIQIDPRLKQAYIDRGIVFYRLHKFDRAFADAAAAKRIEKADRAVMDAMAKKQPLRPLKLDPPHVTRVSQRHTTGVAD
ncbi:DnaJ domain-containing protein [Bradyrhizobium sp. HKCCYLS1011]|uniref:DnaJ domain-containing protein n=1 Tax=Bradyrhizobium sp. HKCCYLS1011 TaxID=3420733 RepID=UPI003EBCC465